MQSKKHKSKTAQASCLQNPIYMYNTAGGIKLEYLSKDWVSIETCLKSTSMAVQFVWKEAGMGSTSIAELDTEAQWRLDDDQKSPLQNLFCPIDYVFARSCYLWLMSTINHVIDIFQNKKSREAKNPQNIAVP